MENITNWLQRRFANTEFMMLILSIIVIATIFAFASKLLAPVLVSIVLAYLFDGMVRRLKAWHIPHTLAVSVVCLFFIAVIILTFVFLMPLLWKQLGNLFAELPTMLKKGQLIFDKLSTRYPNYISTDQIQNLIANYQTDLTNVGKTALSVSVTTIANIMAIIVYAVLVPLMVFFFMKDRDEILAWFSQFMPKKRRLILEVWAEVNDQMGNYIRAKILEMVIVGVVSTIAFAVLGLNYAVLLGALVGLSALIPYVGVILVTIPVLLVGFIQWGLTAHFLYLVIFFFVWMGIDGNLLTPLLFSETLKIHPVAVIIAVLIFGGLWGFWGVFFAIPLATVVKAILNAWLQNQQKFR